MNTYFINPRQVAEQRIVIDGELCHHLANVLRVKPGECLHLSDGVEKVYNGKITEISPKEIIVAIAEEKGMTQEPPIDVTLIQCLPRGDKMEQIIQKTVELGVSTVFPVESKNSQVRLKNKGGEKARRWQKIAAAAAEQCGREMMPVIALPTSLSGALEQLQPGTKLIFCYEKEGIHSLKQELYNFGEKHLALLIGPEGGFAEEEATLILEHGGVSVTMGPRILRTETAGPTALAAVMYELGDWGCFIEN